MSKFDTKFDFYEKSILGPYWKHAKGGVCKALDDVALSMDKGPPALRDQPPPPPAPKPPPKPKEPPKLLLVGIAETVIKIYETGVKIHDWAHSPTPPKQSPPPAPAIIKPRVKPFDIQNIPAAMARIGWPMSAKVMRKWFSGELNYANTDIGAVRGINQDGNPFPESRIDTTMFKLDWILKFPRAKERFDELVSENLFNQAAYTSLKKMFAHRTPSPYHVNPLNLSNGDIQKWHQQYQYQMISVDTTFDDKFLMGLKGVARPNGMWMDDLYGSLGAFSFYAALGGHFYQRIEPTRTRLTIQDSVRVHA